MLRLQEGKYQDKVTWLEKYVEQEIHLIFIKEGFPGLEEIR